MGSISAGGLAIGDHSIAICPTEENLAIGDSSVAAVGGQSIGNHSIAIGEGTMALGQGSIAVGFGSDIGKGEDSITILSGNNSNGYSYSIVSSIDIKRNDIVIINDEKYVVSSVDNGKIKFKSNPYVSLSNVSCKFYRAGGVTYTDGDCNTIAGGAYSVAIGNNT